MGNTAKAVESKLTENEERNNKLKQVSAAMCTELHKITQALTQNREESHNGLVTIDRKLNVLNDEVLTSANARIQKHSGQEWKEHGESRVRQNHPERPYHRWVGVVVGGGARAT